LARSKNARAGGRGVKYLKYAIPLIALVVIGGSYALTLQPTPTYPAAMNFTFNLLVDVSNKNSTQVSAIAPGHPIGEAGGYWATTKYNNDSVDASHYPIYMDSPGIVCTPVCVMHVKSRVVHPFTLGDLFGVWGQTLGENNTIGVPRNGSFAWQFCVGPPRSAVISNEWGSFVLQANVDLTLYFYDTTTGLGCAPS